MEIIAQFELENKERQKAGGNFVTLDRGNGEGAIADAVKNL